MKQQKGLGRGLDAIFSSEKIDTRINPMSELSEIKLSMIDANPTQPRSTFDTESLESLSASIKELGVIQPVTLRRAGADRYILISGERRWRASQMAGLESIPAYIREADDEALHVMALVENLQREDLNPIEIALGLQRLIEECDLTQEALAARVSMKRSSISNYLRLLRLSDEVQYALKRGLITMGHAKAIASVESEECRIELLKICLEQGVSVREAESLAQRLSEAEGAEGAEETERAEGQTKEALTAPKRAVAKGFEGVATRLESIFSGGVEIRSNRSGGGRIVLNFNNREEVERFLSGLSTED